MDKQATAGHLPQLTADTILIDMDGTVTPTEHLGNYFVQVLCGMVAQRRSLPDAQAEELVRSVFDPDNEPITDANLSSLGIDFDDYWQALLRFQQEHFTPFPDAVEMIKQLHAMGVRMFPATTNSALACRAKLARAGLADQFSCSYFTDLFGGAEVYSGGKRSPEFFQALLERVERRADEVVAVGDSLAADFQYAREAGIEQVVIVCRDQPSQWIRQPDGPVLVKSLLLVPQMLQPLRRP